MSDNAPAPVITVVMPAYRETPPILSRAIDSILTQTFRDLELVVVLDNPDNHEAIALLRDMAARDPRVRFTVNEKNRGVWPSYNIGIRLARGAYIAIQDADDKSLPHRLRTLLDFMKANPEVDVVGASLEYVDEATGKNLMTRHYEAAVGGVIRRFCPIAHGTTLRKRGLHERFGFYDESTELRHAADYELWFRWHSQGVKMVNVKDVVYTYYQNQGNIKTLHVRSILSGTVLIKQRYADKLQFTFGDRAYLLGERLAVYLPAPVIRAAFYLYNRLRSLRTG
jgi:glycosyltransferase involved in cell wall biosynthesis